MAAAEYGSECAVAYVEPAGVGAERRHHQRLAVGREAAPAHRAAALRDAGNRVQMPGDLAFTRIAPELMAERQRTDGERCGERTADAVGRLGIVIAGDPHPFARALQRSERGAVLRRKPRRPVAVVKIVAE